MNDGQEQDSMTTNDKSAKSWLKRCIWSVTGMNVISGTISGAAGVLAGHPFDTVKVRLQAQSHVKPVLYRNTLHCLTSTVRLEGIAGLFKGVSSPLVGVTAINTLLFGVYGFFLESQVSHGAVPTLNQIFIAGAGSGLINSIISSPVELAKIQIQNQIGKGNNGFHSPSDFLLRVWRNKGLGECFRGFWATVLRETPSYGVYFATFEALRQLWASEEGGGHPSNFKLVMAGGLSGIAAWMSTYPIDVVKTRIQMQNLFHGSKPLPEYHRSIIQWLKDIVQNEGISGLFRGTTATIIRAFPTNAVIFSTYALTMRWLEEIEPKL